jgi:hypothetical protein
MTTTQIVCISIFGIIAIWIWFLDYTKKTYEKGRADMREWMKTNNFEADNLRAGAVNRGYAEWRIFDHQNGETAFKWVEPYNYKIRQINK